MEAGPVPRGCVLAEMGKEYLPQLQERQKWIRPKLNIKVGDLVLVVDTSTSRNSWPLCRVVRTMPYKDGFVRRVEVRTSVNVYSRPISKLWLLLEADNWASRQAMQGVQYLDSKWKVLLRLWKFCIFDRGSSEHDSGSTEQVWARDYCRPLWHFA